MSFYIESFMPGTSDTPSVVTLTLPSGKTFKGLLSSDVSIQLSNKFGNLLPGVEMLTDLAQALGAVNIPAWIGASAQAWRGTEPVKFNLEVYLVNYKPHLGYEKNIRELASLATISEGDGMYGGTSHLLVQVHGGYAPDAFASNKQHFTDKNQYFAQKNDQNVTGGPTEPEKIDNLESTGGTLWNDRGAQYKGTIKVKIGNRFTLPNLLLTSISITPSVVEVYSPTAGEKPKPLYYRISMGLMTCMSALHTDVDMMFT